MGLKLSRKDIGLLRVGVFQQGARRHFHPQQSHTDGQRFDSSQPLAEEQQEHYPCGCSQTIPLSSTSQRLKQDPRRTARLGCPVPLLQASRATTAAARGAGAADVLGQTVELTPVLQAASPGFAPGQAGGALTQGVIQCSAPLHYAHHTP